MVRKITKKKQGRSSSIPALRSHNLVRNYPTFHSPYDITYNAVYFKICTHAKALSDVFV